MVLLVFLLLLTKQNIHFQIGTRFMGFCSNHWLPIQSYSFGCCCCRWHPWLNQRVNLAHWKFESLIQIYLRIDLNNQQSNWLMAESNFHCPITKFLTLQIDFELSMCKYFCRRSYLCWAIGKRNTVSTYFSKFQNTNLPFPT